MVRAPFSSYVKYLKRPPRATYSVLVGAFQSEKSWLYIYFAFFGVHTFVLRHLARMNQRSMTLVFTMFCGQRQDGCRLCPIAAEGANISATGIMDVVHFIRACTQYSMVDSTVELRVNFLDSVCFRLRLKGMAHSMSTPSDTDYFV